MPKFARPTSYNGRQSNQQKTGAARFATTEEAAAAESKKLIISPSTLNSAVSSLLTDTFASPPPIGSDTPSTGSFTTLTLPAGAATDSSGTGTLIAGVATILNTNILASDKIMVTVSALNATPDLGFLVVTISAGASFTVASFDNGGVALVTDVSSFNYIIIS